MRPPHGSVGRHRRRVRVTCQQRMLDAYRVVEVRSADGAQPAPPEIAERFDGRLFTLRQLEERGVRVIRIDEATGSSPVRSTTRLSTRLGQCELEATLAWGAGRRVIRTTAADGLASTTSSFVDARPSLKRRLPAPSTTGKSISRYSSTR